MIIDRTARYERGFPENTKYREIHILDDLLTKAEIPHTMDRFLDGWQIIYPENGKNRIADAVQHFGSYGAEEDFLEIMGLLTTEEEKCDSVVGHMTAKDVFDRIERHYKNRVEKAR